jgi:hypothetical protein
LAGDGFNSTQFSVPFFVRKQFDKEFIIIEYAGEHGGLVAMASASKGRSTRFKSRRGKSFSESVGIFHDP